MKTLMIFFSLVTPLAAHEAASGWTYPLACCSNKDCREVLDVKEGPNGYTVPSGEVLGYADRRIRRSPDGLFHWCSASGLDTSRTICLFVPPRSF